MKKIVCILTIAAIVLIGTVAAAPVLPDEFYGSVFLNGNPAPAGTVIIAKINGEERGNFTVHESGLYGSPGNFDPRLYVTVKEEDISAANTTITFFVGGVQAFQTIPVKSGNPKLDLFANVNAFATSSTSNSASSSPVGSQGGSGYSSGGSMSPASGTGSSMTTPSSTQSGTVASPVPTESRSSIYYNIDVPVTTAEQTVIATPVITQPVVTTVPPATKAGASPLSIVFFVTSIIAVLSTLGITRLNNRLG